jgi:hypothetical protein
VARIGIIADSELEFDVGFKVSFCGMRVCTWRVKINLPCATRTVAILDTQDLVYKALRNQGGLYGVKRPKSF